jgi:hypothetical protein
VIIKDRTLLDKRFLAMWNEQQSWVPGWRDIQRFINPTRGFFYEAIPNWGRTIDHKSQLSGAPNRAVRTMAAGMRSGLASPSRPWFKIGLEDQDMMEFEPVKEWLEMVQMRMMNVFSKSNVYGGLHSTYEEIGTFGTAGLITLEDFHTVIRLRTFTAGEYMIGNDENQRINAFARGYNMTVGQLIKEFGEENVSPQVLVNWKNGNSDPWIKVCHLIEPNDDRIPDRKNYKNKAFRSITWEKGSPPNLALRVSGFDDFPVMGPRWQTTNTSSVYGWGPGHYSLGDVKQLMQMKKDFLVSLAKVNNPPIQQDGSVQGEANLLPNGVTRYSSTNRDAGVKPAYQINPQLESMQASMDKLQGEIDQNFFKDLFQMLANNDSGQMTAFEVAKRYEEKLALLGPVIEHLESELHDPLIERTFAIMLKTNLLPPPPQEAQGQGLKVEYISMLAQAQQMVGTLAIERTMAFTGNLLAANPAVADVIDFDVAVEKYADLEGVPAEIVRTKDEIAKLRQDRAKAQQQAQQMQQAQALVEGAHTLSQTPVGRGSALDAITGAPTQPEPAGAGK